MCGPESELFILTGAPGAGKTAVLDALGDDGHRVGEPAREVLAELRDTLVFHEALVDAFDRTGYTLMTVPKGSIEDRAAFVLDFLSRRGVRGA